MSATILLARHAAHDDLGHVLSGRSEIALNEVGREQAQRLAVRLSSTPIQRISTSPRRRARETAEAIAKPRSFAPIEVAALDEIDFGEWSGLSFADLEADMRWRFWNTARGRASTPSGETMSNVTMRAVRHLESCQGFDVVLCVSHCDLIRGLVAHYVGLDADRLMSFEIDPASITTIRLEDGYGKVVAVNERLY